MRSVRFFQDRVVDDCRKGTPDEERYEAGKVYQLADTSADRWVSRGIAEYADKTQIATAGQASTPAPAEVKPTAPALVKVVPARDLPAAPGPTARQGMPRARPTA